MDSKYSPYDHTRSFGRIDQILSLPSGSFEETDSLPTRDSLTFDNGYYANCSAVFADLRDSSNLPNKYRRPVLAKIYRAYLSEVIAIMNSDSAAREVSIAGDAAWSVVNTPLRNYIDDVFQTMYRINSMMKVLNYKMIRKGYDTPIKAGIGAAWGRALMVKAGHSGSGVNDVVYMGDVVNEAAKLANIANSGGADPIYVSANFYGNLNDHNKNLLRQTRATAYSGNVVDTAMEDWYRANCN